jgi:hypothetical protein
MSLESSDEPARWNCARDSLVKVWACSDRLQTFVGDVFDQLDRLTNELLAQQLERPWVQRQGERLALHDQIDQLASVATKLTQSLTEQTQLIG